MFNQVLGLKIVRMEAERVVGRIEMKPELIGNFVHGILHGGVSVVLAVARALTMNETR